MEKIPDDIRRDAHAKLKGANGGIKELADAINIMLQLLRMAHSDGRLSLNDPSENVGSSYLTYLTKLLVFDHPPMKIVELGSNAYWEYDPQGVRAMIYCIYLRGIISIDEGDTPQEALETLLSILPPDPHWKIEEQTIRYLEEPERRFFHIRPAFQDTDTLEQVAALNKEMGLLSDHALHMFMEDFDGSYLDSLTDVVYALAQNKELCERFLSYFDEESRRILKQRAMRKYDIDKSHISISGAIFCMKALRERDEALTTRKAETEKAEKILEEIRQDAMDKLKNTKEGLKNLEQAFGIHPPLHHWATEDPLEDAMYEIRDVSHMVLEHGAHKLRDIDLPSGFLKSIAIQVADEIRPELIIRNAADAYWMDGPEGVQAMVYYIYLWGMIRIRQGNIYNFFIRNLERKLLPKK